MKKILSVLLLLVACYANAATTLPVQLINPTGSSSGQAIVSTGASSAPAWSGVNAVTLNGATFSAPGPIGSTTASTGAFTTLSASGTVSGAGFSTYLASPPAIGGTAPAAGAFTTLSSSSASKVFATNTSAQSVATATLTTLTGWTTTFDANSDFTASTGIFTAPRAGYYHVSASVQFVGTTWTAAQSEIISISKNGTTIAQVQIFVPANYSGSYSSAPITALISCVATDTITIRVFQNSGASLALAGTGSLNFLSIEQVP